ncbi:MAG TPA: response regulator [Acidobacteriaceae bacterium]|nr:response regulator [Acidobacteriaceae bacterium]
MLLWLFPLGKDQVSQSENFATVPLADLFAKGIAAQNDPRNPVVLVVDDEVVIADTLTTILSHHSIAAMTAYDGAGALEIARIIPPDLLLADVVMPGMSGIDVAMAIKKDIPDCAILLFSGQAATAGLLAKAGKAWCDFEVLLKPIHPQKLVQLIFERLHVQPTKQPSGRVEQDEALRRAAIS